MEPVSAFSGFSVKNAAEAKEFYAQKLGLTVSEEAMGLYLHLPGGVRVFVYEKADHQPATFTVLNLVVENIDTAVQELKNRGVDFEHYDFGNGAATDANGIMRPETASDGPSIAWFKDPSGNTMAVLEQ